MQEVDLKVSAAPRRRCGFEKEEKEEKEGRIFGICHNSLIILDENLNDLGLDLIYWL